MGEVKTKQETTEIKDKVDSVKQDVADLAKLVKGEVTSRLSRAKEKLVDGPGDWAKEHPGASIGIIAGVAASVGFILGLVVGRGRD
jgi:ElaB/YqjD/DUF883 family membrane-anchored ribosome-binding protein